MCTEVGEHLRVIPSWVPVTNSGCKPSQQLVSLYLSSPKTLFHYRNGGWLFCIAVMWGLYLHPQKATVSCKDIDCEVGDPFQFCFGGFVRGARVQGHPAETDTIQKQRQSNIGNVQESNNNTSIQSLLKINLSWSWSLIPALGRQGQADLWF